MNRITINPNQCGGRPCVRGMRIRVKDVLDMLAEGATPEEILADFPDLEAEDLEACVAACPTGSDPRPEVQPRGASLFAASKRTRYQRVSVGPRLRRNSFD